MGRPKLVNVLLKKRTKVQEKRIVPTVFRFPCSLKEQHHAKVRQTNSNSEEAKDDKVYLAGTMTNWKALPMGRPVGESDHVSILECVEGDVHYKFRYRGEWLHDPAQKTVRSRDGARTWNVIKVDSADNDVFEALACDSFSLKDDRHETGHQSDTDRLQEDLWNQEKPSEAVLSLYKNKGPPILPPHLLQILLNKEQPESADPIILPEPSHVSLHHLYAQSIRERMLVLSSTTRFRKKCVTSVFYKPLDPPDAPRIPERIVTALNS